MNRLVILSFIFVIFIIFLSGCGETNPYLKQYPCFSQVKEFKEEGYVLLNNFDPKKNKNGFEYLVSDAGKLIEIRNWKNNLLNGNVFSYATNGKLKMFGNYVNDTLCNYLYILDTIKSNVENYREKVKDGEVVIDNQVIDFKDGKVDVEHSQFYSVRHLYGNTYRIFWLGKRDDPFMKILVYEINEDKYVFENDINSLWIDIGTSNYYDYNLKDTTCKYISGSILNYRYLTVEEIKEQGAKQGEISGLIMNFKYCLMQK